MSDSGFVPTVDQLFDPEVCLSCGGHVLHGLRDSCNHRWNGLVQRPAAPSSVSSASVLGDTE